MILIRHSHFQEASVVEQEMGVLGVWVLGEQIQTRRSKTKQDRDARVKRVCLKIRTWFLKMNSYHCYPHQSAPGFV